MKKYTVTTHDRNGAGYSLNITSDMNMKEMISALRNGVYGTLYGTTMIYRIYENGKTTAAHNVQF